MTDSGWWPADYFASRKKFTDMALACGASHKAHPIEATGQNGQLLSVDVAALTSENDEHRIFLVSGVHGVEGFIGASAQVQAMQRLARQGRPEGIGIVLIHAANPWGYAHLRRVDENNVDVNRNFIDSADSARPENQRYAALDPVINSRNAPGLTEEILYWLKAGKLIIRNRGIRSLFKTIAEGQYDFPKGLFYGGSRSGEACKLLQQLVAGYTQDVPRVTILDVHSGLGPSGTATLIGNSNMTQIEHQSAWLSAHYEQPVVIDNGDGNPYNAHGSFSKWCKDALSDRQFLYLCVEIGTVNPIKLFSALRRENQARHWAGGSSSCRDKTSQVLLNVFAPRSEHWRSMANAQALKVFERTFELDRFDS